ncbi:MAG TPA: DEAD/DEAH box helicase, partial [Candidatus Limnocylindrales bacterium]
DIGDAAEVWAPFVAPAVGLDHLGDDTILVLDEPGDLAEAGEFLWSQADERRGDLVKAGELPERWPSTYLPKKAWAARLQAATTLELTWESELPRGLAKGRDAFGDAFGWREPVLPPGRAQRIADAAARWRGRTPPPRIVVASDQAPRLAELLDEAGETVGVTDVVDIAPPVGSVTIVDRSLNGGFDGGPEGLTFVTDRELFGNVRVRRPKALRRVVPRDILERLTPGDLVVHIDHGVARYERMLRRSSGAGDERDYLELSFAAGDRIFVPVEQIGRVSRYSGGERPQLSRLGGTDWQRTKERVRKAVSDLAEELLALYASRADAPGHAFAPDSPWQAELEASFPYEETPDQLRAIVEVKHDMEAGRPMDRLVVGDVGYGKTEVALRAAFKATQDSKQVAILVPTTVLAAQHYETFRARFAAFPVKVGLLSRFVPKAEQDATIRGLTDGSVDIVIGTHRLLSRDVRFRDLGLLVVDEEQRFGVVHKERIKQLRKKVDVLTMTA